MNRCRRLVFFLTLTLPASVIGQTVEHSKITGVYANVPIVEVLQDIEKNSGAFFYYDILQIDSCIVSGSFTAAPIDSVLNELLEGRDLYWSKLEPNYFFISKGRAVRTIAGQPAGQTKSGKSVQPQVQVSRDSGQGHLLATTESRLYEVGDPKQTQKAGRATIAGYVRDEKTGEPISGVSIRVEKLGSGVITDDYGYFSFNLPKGKHQFSIQSTGMQDTRRNLNIHSDGNIDFEMKGLVTTLKHVVVSAQKVSNVKGTQLGVQKIDIKQIRQVPVVFGEADVLRVVTTLPGVKTVGEASTGLNVRGGATDQNLILFNEATIYNPSHFFGLFSAFNPDVVKDVVLYKSTIPARYGGRLSSVLDISSREGNKKNVAGSLGIGPLTSRVAIEGPIGRKEKTSFIVGGRSTYANWLLKLLPQEYENSAANFYDANVILSHEVNKKNNIYVSGYISNDRFSLNSDTIYRYKNMNASIRWKHIYNNKVNSVFSAGIDKYTYAIESDRNPVTAYKLDFSIQQLYFRAHTNYYLNSNHTIDFGFNSIMYRLQPGNYLPNGGESLVKADRIPEERALESAVYLNDKYDISATLTLEAGIRFSVYNMVGPKSVNLYSDGLPKTEENMIGTELYSSGKFVHTYGGPEYRVSVRKMLGLNSSVKAGINTQRQYMHMLSNTAAMAPTDIWKLSDPNIKPQNGVQVSLGYYQNVKSNTIEISAEVYYKKIRDYLDYKSGANLVMNSFIERDVINTRGKAYGAELLVKKTAGKLTGWVSYTWSRILLKQDDAKAGEIINDGEYYPANYDKPHDFTFIGNYRINHRFSLSFNTTYSTGRPITLPIGRFYYSGSYRTLYADRNTHRIPDYLRADFSMNIDGNHKVKQKFHNSWTIGVYNLTGRKNPYSVYYVSEGGAINGYKLSIFGSAIPFISYNVKF